MRYNASAVAFLGLVLAALLAVGADTPPAAPTPPRATKGTLPRDWKKLGLTDEQKVKAYAITADAKDKLAKLEAEIAAIKADEHKKLDALLTPDQRGALVELLSGVPASAPSDKGTGTPAKP